MHAAHFPLIMRIFGVRTSLRKWRLLLRKVRCFSIVGRSFWNFSILRENAQMRLSLMEREIFFEASGVNHSSCFSVLFEIFYTKIYLFFLENGGTAVPPPTYACYSQYWFKSGHKSSQIIYVY